MTVDADWSVEAAADDPVVVAPWLAEPVSATLSGADVSGFVDLRSATANKTGDDSAAVDRLPEAVAYPALRQALLRLNDARACLRTAKCDVWEMDQEEMEALRARFDLARGPCGLGSYVDVLLDDGSAPGDLHVHEGWVRRMVDAAGRIDAVDETGESASCAEFIVRPAHVDGAWGYAVSVYVWSVGDDARSAQERWAAALGGIVSVVMQTAPQPRRDTMCATGE